MSCTRHWSLRSRSPRWRSAPRHPFPLPIGLCKVASRIYQRHSRGPSPLPSPFPSVSLSLHPRSVIPPTHESLPPTGNSPCAPSWKVWIPPKLSQGLQQGGVYVFDGRTAVFEHKDAGTGAFANLDQVLSAAASSAACKTE